MTIAGDPRRRRRKTWFGGPPRPFAEGLPLLAIILLAACATASAPGPPGPEIAEGADAQAPQAQAADAGAARQPPAADTTAAPGLAEPLPAVGRLPEPEPEPSVLPFGVLWTPREPAEGSALAVRLLQPVGGRLPASVEGRLADLPVRFAQREGVWLGIAGLPIGAKGELELSIDVTFADGSTRTERVPLTVRSRTWSSTNLRVAPRFTSPPPEALERIRRERLAIRAVLDATTPEWLIRGRFALPRPLEVTSPFGQARLFNGELQSRHTGLDLAGEEGAPVAAAGAGRVALTGDFYYSGKGVFIDHGRGVYTGYFHLSRILVEEGQMVSRGQLIGEVGATGRVTGPHLHWSLWVAGKGLDAGTLLEMEIPGD